MNRIFTLLLCVFAFLIHSQDREGVLLAETNQGLPVCLKRESGQPNSEIIRAAKLSDLELLTRLVFAEGISTNYESSSECSTQSSAIFESIAWGVMNRVRLSELIPSAKKEFGSKLFGVIFKSRQFNPAISIKSKFSGIFLCPSEQFQKISGWPKNGLKSWKEVWKQAQKGSQRALSSPDQNPFLQTEWERAHQVAWVVQFYYPRSIQALANPPAWADASDQSKTLVRKLKIEDVFLNPQCIWFFRR